MLYVVSVTSKEKPEPWDIMVINGKQNVLRAIDGFMKRNAKREHPYEKLTITIES